MPSPEAKPRRRIDAATATWVALLALTLLGVAASLQDSSGLKRLVAAWLVAGVAAFKADLLIRHYLHVRAAGPVFEWLVRTFAVLAPLGLALSALREAWPG